MRRAIGLALLTLAGCSKPLPPGVELVTSGQTFFWSPSSRRLAG